MDKRGGKREGAGRKSKAEEQELVEKLSPLDEVAFKALQVGLMDGQHWAVKLFMQYRYGMPKQVVDVTTKSEGSISVDKWVGDNKE